ncbi:deacylase [Alsobacter soli]|uniref:Deacylase n=1 Tax=Alsobacter soli TaxID=2109933 RepID=A0A2T1HP81_9HYPH|nr:succinylglutamate desuccinylase/aspartoacylase family protein [Alsobacter soli]PSC03464.1 deacylase [Alsobacter soli]
MRTEVLDLPPELPGLRRTLTVQRFGEPGARPLAYVQASLHADEIPGMMAVVHLRELLLRMERDGRINGEIILVPVANPLGLQQRVLGGHIGRFDLADGLNFNRGFPALGEAVAERVGARLGEDADANVQAIRAAALEAAEGLAAVTPAEHLKKALLRLALPADLVLDLHCDSEALVHLYTLTPLSDLGAELGAELGAGALLLADVSGDDPFDEAVTRPWVEVAARFPEHPVPLACFSCTVEFRGTQDVADSTGAADAAAIVRFLQRRGVLAGDPGPLPASLCEATELAASEPLSAPVAGIVAFRRDLGARVGAGETVAEVIDPYSGARTAVTATQGGLLFARTSARFAMPGQRLGKVAGTVPVQRGSKLLSP